MFLATHLPVQRVMEQLPASDKHLHLGAYAVLGFALPWWSRERAQHWRSQWHPWLLYALLLSYAAIDELLQIPVGRSAEWGDWLADAAGAAIGLAVANWLRRG
jgi:VanZ family protein